MTEGFEWANVAFTLVNAGLTGFTAWVGYKVWRSTLDADLPALSYQFYRDVDGASIAIEALNRADVPWVLEGVGVRQPSKVKFSIPILGDAPNDWSPAPKVSEDLVSKIAIAWTLGAAGSSGNPLHNGATAKSHHHYGLSIPKKFSGTIKVDVAFYSREARIRRHRETITIRLKNERQTVPA